MLRAVTLENFILLKERQELQFEGGAYFFIGENASGKSSVLEAIRRCLSVRVNSSFSTIGDPQNDSYVVCKYDQDDCKLSEYSTLLACQFYLGEEEEEKHNKSRYKLAALLDKNNQVLDIGIDFAREADEGSGLNNCSVELEATEKTKLREVIRRDLSVDKSAVLDVLDILRHHHNKIALPSRRKDDTKSELILSKLDETFAFLFENRSTCSLQKADCRERANKWSCQHRFHIIKHLLDDLSEEEIERGNEIFGNITGDQRFEFEINKEDDEPPPEKGEMDDDGSSSIITMSTETDAHEILGAKVTVKEGGISFDVQKMSEGFLEALQCSLILARTYFKTICLEHPYREMSPQMIQRFRDMVLGNPKLETQTILITTHNPAFMAPWTVPKTFIFRRKHLGKSISQKIIQGNLLQRGDYERMSWLRTSTSSEFFRLLFSRKVIIVEGDNNLKFLTALKHKILQGAEEVRNILRHIAPKDVDNEFTQLKQFMSVIDTIQMTGETHIERISEICKTLELDYFFLLDKNIVVINECQKETNFHKLINVEGVFGYISSFGVSPEVNDSNWGFIREEFNQHGIYIWRNGDLEDMVIEIPGEPEENEEGKIKEHDMHRQLREENHVIPLDRYQKKKHRARYRLYSSKKLTNRNIWKGMEIMLKACEEQQNDLVGFIGFLRKYAKMDPPAPRTGLRYTKENEPLRKKSKYSRDVPLGPSVCSDCSQDHISTVQHYRLDQEKTENNDQIYLFAASWNSMPDFKGFDESDSEGDGTQDTCSQEIPFLSPSLIRTHIKKKGNQSKEIHRLLQWMCSRVEASVPDVLQVWPGYRETDASEPVFATIVKEENRDNPKEFDTFQLLVREDCQVSDEAKYVVKLEQERGLHFTDEESHKLQACFTKHTTDLMKKHRNLQLVSASKIKSKKYGLEDSSTEILTCIVFYVQIKGIIPFEEEPFPVTLDGFPVDVREGLFQPYSDPCEHHQRLMMGCQIESAYGKRGTLGGFVELNNGNIGCLTCCHVFVSDSSKADIEIDPIGHAYFKKDVYQPRGQDDNFRFGVLLGAHLLPGNDVNIGIDAALIEINDPLRTPTSGCFPNAVSSIAGFSPEKPMKFNCGKVLKSFEEVPKTCRVVKYGFNTGHTVGLLRLAGPAAHKRKFVYQTSSNPQDTWELHQQLEVFPLQGQPFSSFGDSGSLVFLVKDDGDDYDITALGLLVGGTSHNTTIITPIWAVLEKFGLPLKLLSFGAAADTGVQADSSESQRLDVLELDATSVKSDIETLKTSVTNLQQDMTSVKSDLTPVKSDITSVKSNITSIKSDVAAVKSDITSVKTDVDSLNTGVSKLDAKLDQFQASIHESIQESMQFQMAEMKNFFQSMLRPRQENKDNEDTDSGDM